MVVVIINGKKVSIKKDLLHKMIYISMMDGWYMDLNDTDTDQINILHGMLESDEESIDGFEEQAKGLKELLAGGLK